VSSIVSCDWSDRNTVSMNELLISSLSPIIIVHGIVQTHEEWRDVISSHRGKGCLLPVLLLLNYNKGHDLFESVS